MFYQTIFAVANDIYAIKDPGGNIQYIKRELRAGEEDQPSIQYDVDSITAEEQFELLDLLTVSEWLDFLITEVECQLAML